MFDKKTIVVCYSEDSRGKLKSLLTENGFDSVNVDSSEDVSKLNDNAIALTTKEIENNPENNDFVVITEREFFEEELIHLTSEDRALEKILSEQNDLNVGDLVINRDYGLGRFTGLETISLDSIKNDYLKIEYAKNSFLFIPIEDIDLVTKYSEYDPGVELDSLGNERWIVKRNRVKEKLESIAEDLIKIASIRKLSKAPILVAPENEYKEFCSLFKYKETNDQLKAIRDIERDFSRGIPADRLICGDVGFGKTEVALRATFIAASSEKNAVQVAVVVPTTLLARQHYALFKERFKYTSINVGMLSRLNSSAENKRVKTNLEKGSIHIVIGTHALFSKDVKFKNLGLLIIDEEQRFGVKHKEKLKEISSGIHLITLSATPIPRTLQMSLTGIKDLSLITTPPVDRLNIDTQVMKFNETIIKAAINKELSRGGKVIMIVPRIFDIMHLETRLKDILSNTEYKTAHGQMPGSILDKIMNDFYEGKFRVLIATTIVESGLDIPDANTIIIHRANRFGLSQLHQLRGRVGRGKEKAYAYLMVNETDRMTDTAIRRLKSIEAIQNVGGGFAIANDDMDIRGSGNIVGEEQSGHIRNIGIELYNQMLVEAVNKIKNTGGFSSEFYDFSPQVKLNISTTIDKNYISDIPQRLRYYKKLANIRNEREREDIVKELETKFGKVPNEINNILEITKIKNLARNIGITKLEYSDGFVNINFYNDSFKSPDYLMKLIKDGKAIMKGQNTISFLVSQSKMFEDISSILKDLSRF